METLTPRKTYRYSTQQKVCRQALAEAEGAASRQEVGHTGKSLQFELVFVFLWVKPGLRQPKQFWDSCQAPPACG